MKNDREHTKAADKNDITWGFFDLADHLGMVILKHLQIDPSSVARFGFQKKVTHNPDSPEKNTCAFVYTTNAGEVYEHFFTEAQKQEFLRLGYERFIERNRNHK